MLSNPNFPPLSWLGYYISVTMRAGSGDSCKSLLRDSYSCVPQPVEKNNGAKVCMALADRKMFEGLTLIFSEGQNAISCSEWLVVLCTDLASLSRPPERSCLY